MKKKFVNILNIIEVVDRLMRGLTVEGSLYIDKDTHMLSFRPYRMAKYQPGYYRKRPKLRLIKKLPWGWLKKSVKNNMLYVSVPEELGTTLTMAVIDEHARMAKDALIDEELKEFC